MQSGDIGMPTRGHQHAMRGHQHANEGSSSCNEGPSAFDVSVHSSRLSVQRPKKSSPPACND